MLHPMFVRFANVIDFDAIWRRRSDRIYHLLHLRVCSVKIADIISQNALRTWHIGSIVAASVEIEFLVLLSKRNKRGGQAERYQGKQADGFDHNGAKRRSHSF